MATRITESVTLRPICTTRRDSPLSVWNWRSDRTGLPNRIIDACSRLRPDLDRLDDPTQATKAALRSIALRARTLRDEIQALDRQIQRLLTATAPATLDVFAMGPDTTAVLLVSVGDNPGRLRSGAAFVRLCGVAPSRLLRQDQPAPPPPRCRPLRQPGAAHRHHRSDALLPPAPAPTFLAAPPEALSKPEIIRCVKRYLAREIYRTLRADRLHRPHHLT